MTGVEEFGFDTCIGEEECADTQMVEAINVWQEIERERK